MAKENPNTVPLAEIVGLMAKELCYLPISQKITKKENPLLLAAARKAKVDEGVSKLSNPMSVRAVKLNFRVLHLLEDILSVLKPEGVVLVPTDLVKVGAMIVVLLEEVTRLLLRELRGLPSGKR